MKNSRPAALVVNTRSRRGQRSFTLAKTLLETAGFEISGYPITDPEALSAQVKTLVEAGVSLIIIGGGDGTVSQVVDHLVYKNIVLGILPLGTANSFSRSLDIPADLTQAVRVIATGKVTEIDLGKINNDYFANAVSIGFASQIADRIPHLLKRYFGVFSYAIQCVLSLPHLRAFDATFHAKTQIQNVNTYQIVIANGGYYGPAPLVAKTRLHSADLSIFTFTNLRPFQIFMIWLRSLRGKRFSQQIERILVKDELLLTTTPVQKVSIDGEVKTHTPIRISVAPQALKILVPQQSEL